jgi:hypothetical protein
VLFTRREPDDISGPDLLDWSTIALSPAAPGSDDQGLAQWMCMPGGPCAGFKRDDGSGDARGCLSLERRIDPHETREPIRGASARWL